MGLKFNPLLNNGFDFTGSGGGGGGVTSVNGISGAVTLAAGTNITLVPAGSTITINATSSGSSPGGVDTNVQFNDGGVFGGNSQFVFLKTVHSLAIGTGHTLTGNRAFALGASSVASGDNSFAQGNTATASGASSYAGGFTTTASGTNSHAEGQGTVANANNTHAEGLSTTASGIAAHSEGSSGTASGNNSHVEGLSSTASGVSAHAEGQGTIASGNASHTAGIGTASAADGQTSVGQYNVIVGTPGSPLSTDQVFSVGIGTGTGSRATSLSVRRDGLISANTHLISNVVDPVSPQDAATKAYVDAAGTGANTALSNLASTAVNANIIPSLNNNIDLGDTALRWRNVYVTTINSGSATLNVTGNGQVNFNGSRLEQVADPIVSDDAATKNYVDTHLPTFNKENLTLNGTDITNQYKDLAHLVKPSSLTLAVTKTYQVEGDDYILSTVGLITRLTFNNDLATGGVSALVAGNILNIQYAY